MLRTLWYRACLLLSPPTRRGPARVSNRKSHVCLVLDGLEDRLLLSFVTPINYDGGPVFTTGSALGDFNGDGIPDLVFLNSDQFGGNPSLSVLLGNGDGTFQPAIFSGSVAGYSSGLVVADFRGNGRSDVVTVARDGHLGVFLSNGDGTFQAPLELPVSTYAYVAAGDLNGDHIPDLVVGAGGGVMVFFGNGDGTFQPPATYPLPCGGAWNVLIDDFNGDGIPDIVARDRGCGFPPRPPGFDVLIGNGDGTFQSPIRTVDQPALEPTFLVAADLNHDKNADLVFITSYANTVIVRLNNGDGTFGAPIYYDLGRPISSVFVTDLDKDGNPDLLIPGAAPGAVKVLLGNGDGTFHFGRDLFVGRDLSAMPVTVFGDFNGDGFLDLAFALDLGHGVGVRLGKPDGSFQTTPTFPSGQRPYGVAVGDFNGDGVPDLAVTNNNRNGTVSILLGNGNGTFRAPQTFATVSYPASILAGDFNNDNHLDLVAANQDGIGVQLFLGNGDGTFQPPSTVSATGANLVAGDFNDDGNLDLVVADGSTVKLLLGNGDGTFQSPVVILNSSGPLAVGDFNGDHQLDLAVLNFNAHAVTILLGNGNGTFQPARSYAVGSNFRSSMAAADLRGDGHDDLVVSFEGDGLYSPGFVSVLLSNPDGTFQPAVDYQVGPEPSALAIADFTGEGKPDIAVMESSTVRVLPGNGDGTFQVNPFGYTVGGFLGNRMAAADFNGHGFLDLVATNTSDDNVAVLINAGYWPAGQHSARPSHSRFLLASENSIPDRVWELMGRDWLRRTDADPFVGQGLRANHVSLPSIHWFLPGAELERFYGATAGKAGTLPVARVHHELDNALELWLQTFDQPDRLLLAILA